MILITGTAVVQILYRVWYCNVRHTAVRYVELDGRLGVLSFLIVWLVGSLVGCKFGQYLSTVQYSTVQYSTVVKVPVWLDCTGTVLYCTVLYFKYWYCTVQYCKLRWSEGCTVLYILYSTVQY